MGLANRSEYMVFRADQNGTVRGVSSSLCAFLGSERDHYLGKPFLTFIGDESREEAVRSLLRLKSPPHLYYIELNTKRKKGNQWVGWSMKSIPQEGEQPLILGVGVQLEEGVEAGKTLRRLNLQYDTLARGIQKISGAGSITDVLRNIIRTGIDLVEGESGTAGLSSGEEIIFREFLKGGNIFSIHHTFHKGYGMAGKVLETGESVVVADAKGNPLVPTDFSMNLEIKNGAAIPLKSRRGEVIGCFEIYNSPQEKPFDRDDLHMLQTLADTGASALERIRVLEKESSRKEDLFRLSRGVMETMNILSPVGETGEVKEPSPLPEESGLKRKVEEMDSLVGGIAHSVNNSLATISGTCELLKMRKEGDLDLQARIDLIMNAVTNTASLVDQLLAYNRKQIATPRVLNLNTLISEFQSDLMKAVGDYVLLEINLSDGLWSIKMDPKQLREIIFNLVNNSCEAMPHGGSIQINTDNTIVDSAAAARNPGMKTGKYVTITVADKGAGIDKDVLPRIFIPFFSTKSYKNARGMGLTTVFGITKQNGGYITVKSEPGSGASFTVYFPSI